MFKWLRRRPVEDQEYMHSILANHIRAFNNMHAEMVGLVKRELALRDAEIIKLRAQLDALRKEKVLDELIADASALGASGKEKG